MTHEDIHAVANNETFTGFNKISPVFHVDASKVVLDRLANEVEQHEEENLYLTEDIEAQKPEIDENEPVDIIEFVRRHTYVLDSSARAWGDVAKIVRASRSDASVQKNLEALELWCQHNGLSKPSSVLESQARTLARDLSVNELKTARYRAAYTDEVDFERRMLDDTPFNFADKAVEFVQRPNPEVRFSRISRLAHMSADIEFADYCTKVTLENLVKQYARQPAMLLQLSELYGRDKNPENPQVAELGEMISTDWLRPDKENSILRQFIKQAVESPAIFVESFVAEVTDETLHVRRWPVIAAMASFAAQVAAEKGVTLTPADALQATRDKWDNFSEIETAFSNYVDQTLQQIEKCFIEIATCRGTGTIRAHVTADEIRSYNNSLQAPGLHRVSREARRTQRKNRPQKSVLVKTQEVDRSLEQHLGAAEINTTEPRPLYAVRKGQGVFHGAEVEYDDLLRDFKITEPRTQDDVKRMLELIQTDIRNVHRGSKFLEKTSDVRIVANGLETMMRLRRFAPNSVGAHLQVHPDNRFLRIVYGVPRGLNVVCVLDMLPHNEFDKKYS